MRCELKDKHKIYEHKHKIFEHIVRRSSSEQEIHLITSKENNMHFSSIWITLSIRERYFHQNLSHAWHLRCEIWFALYKHNSKISLENITQHSNSKESQRASSSGNSKTQVLISAEMWFSFLYIKCVRLKNGTKVEYTIRNTNLSCLIKIGLQTKSLYISRRSSIDN